MKTNKCIWLIFSKCLPPYIFWEIILWPNNKMTALLHPVLLCNMNFNPLVLVCCFFIQVSQPKHMWWSSDIFRNHIACVAARFKSPMNIHYYTYWPILYDIIPCVTEWVCLLERKKKLYRCGIKHSMFICVHAMRVRAWDMPSKYHNLCMWVVVSYVNDVYYI